MAVEIIRRQVEVGMTHKLVIGTGIPNNVREILEKAGVEVVVASLDTEKDIMANAPDADALLARNDPVTRRVIEALSRCKVISRGGVGYDSIDVDAATEHGIIVTSVPDASVDEVSDHAIALLLALSRKIVALDKAVKNELWTQEAKDADKARSVIRAPIRRLKGRTLGEVGMGRIGSAVVSKAGVFGLRIIVYDPYLPKDVADKAGVELVDFDALLHESDFICLNASLTAETRNMFGLEQFKKMKPTAYIINVGRGALINEEDLCSALSQGLIAGAALDVLVNEPPTRKNPLLKMENVLITAHSAAYSVDSIEESRLRAAQDIIDVLQGRWPRGIVNPEVKNRRNCRMLSQG